MRTLSKLSILNRSRLNTHILLHIALYNVVMIQANPYLKICLISYLYLAQSRLVNKYRHVYIVF